MIIIRTPLRVSFVGGGTDLPSFCNKERGAVVSICIKKYIYIVIHNSFSDKNIIAYSRREVTKDVEQIQNTRIKEAMKLTGITKGIELHSLAEVPSGTGLGSSSSFTVGLLNALYAHQNKITSAEKLAREASEIEIDILKEPIGRQDQYAAAFGGLNKIEFVKNEVKIKPIVCKPETKKKLQNNLILFYLGGKRDASNILTQQNKNLDNNHEIFQMHIQMRNLADEMEIALANNNLDKFGELLHKNWLLKKQLVRGMSNPEIDKYYNAALEAGAKGGKLLGAGGCGFLLIYAEPDQQNKVRSALYDLKEEKIEIDTEGSRIIYVGN